ncbi:MAG: cation transporter, partial [Chitinophagales bacterium]|nr:cation transporter [Chitinophagales bacterium]
YSLYLSAQPKDDNHPYGHGKVEFIAAGFEGILISLAGVLMIVKSIVAFFEPRQLEHLDIGMGIVVGSGVINFIIGSWLVNTGVVNNSLTLRSDGEHLKSDAYSSFGILGGLLLIKFTGLQWLDNAVAIAFAFFIIYTGIKLVRKSLSGIMDEADEEIIERLVKLLSTHRQNKWIDIHNIRVIQYGNKLHVDCHTTLPWYISLQEAHTEMEAIATLVNEKFSSQVEFFIHSDPCIPESCKICMIESCKERKDPFQMKMEWDMQNMTRNKKHGL